MPKHVGVENLERINKTSATSLVFLQTKCGFIYLFIYCIGGLRRHHGDSTVYESQHLRWMKCSSGRMIVAEPVLSLLDQFDAIGPRACVEFCALIIFKNTQRDNYLSD
jgi:hypothetical protein